MGSLLEMTYRRCQFSARAEAWPLNEMGTFTHNNIHNYFLVFFLPHILCQSHGSYLLRFMTENPGQFTAILWTVQNTLCS